MRGQPFGVLGVQLERQPFGVLGVQLERSTFWCIPMVSVARIQIQKCLVPHTQQKCEQLNPAGRL